jgi:acetylornithine aminotransferase
VGNRAKGVFKPGNHGSTFGGNPLAMTAVVTTIDTIKEEKLMERALKAGDAIRDGVRDAVKGLQGVSDIRGMGSMIGVELARGCGELVLQSLQAGLVLNVTSDNVIRMLPPLVMNEAEAGEVVGRLTPILRSFLQSRAAA